MSQIAVHTFWVRREPKQWTVYPDPLAYRKTGPLPYIAMHFDEPPIVINYETMGFRLGHLIAAIGEGFLGLAIHEMMLSGGIELRDDKSREVVWSRYLPRCLEPDEKRGVDPGE